MNHNTLIHQASLLMAEHLRIMGIYIGTDTLESLIVDYPLPSIIKAIKASYDVSGGFDSIELLKQLELSSIKK